MNEFEIEILKNLIGLKIKKILFSGVLYDFHNPNHMTSHDGIMLSFYNKDDRKNQEYLCVDPIPGLSLKGSFVFLKFWQYIHKQSLRYSMHYPQQNLDSKFKTSFNVSHLGKLMRVTAIARPNLPEGLLSFFFETRNAYFIIMDRSIYIFLNNDLDDKAFFENYFETSDMITVADIS